MMVAHCAGLTGERRRHRGDRRWRGATRVDGQLRHLAVQDPPCLLLGINVTSATRGGDGDPSVNFQGSLRTLPQF